MSFTKPYTYVTGTVVDATAQSSNDDAAKKSINQGILAADYTTEMIDFDQIESGELEAIASGYRFMSGEICGQASTTTPADRAYFTSHIRNGKQTAVDPAIYQTIYETGQTLDIIHDAEILISFGGTFISAENDIQPTGRWDTQVILRYRQEGSNNWENIAGTVAYSFEETHDPGAAPRAVTNLNPFTFSYPSSVDPQSSFRRWIGWTWMVKNIPPGRWSFSVAVRSKVESGFSSARSFTCEVFYA